MDKKILILRHKLTAFGGAELIFLKEAEYFQAQGYEMKLMAFEVSPAFREKLSGFDLQVPEGGFWRQVAELRNLIKSKNFDAVIAHENGHIHLLFATLFMKSRPKLLLHWYGSFLWLTGSRLNHSWFHRANVKKLIKDWPGHKQFQADYAKHLSIKERIRSELQAFLDYCAIRNFDTVATCSRYAAGECGLLYGRKAEIIPGGVDTELFSPRDRATARAKLQLSDRKMIFTVNRLDPRKRLDVLIRSMKEIDALLVIAGTGPEEPNLKALAAGQENIIFAGFVADELLPDYYAAADVVAYPAWCAWGLVPLEALSMNRRTAISKDALISEALKGQPNSFVAGPEDDEFTEILRQALRAEDRNSRELMQEEFDWKIYFRKIGSFI